MYIFLIIFYCLSVLSNPPELESSVEGAGVDSLDHTRDSGMTPGEVSERVANTTTITSTNTSDNLPMPTPTVLSEPPRDKRSHVQREQLMELPSMPRFDFMETHSNTQRRGGSGSYQLTGPRRGNQGHQ